MTARTLLLRVVKRVTSLEKTLDEFIDIECLNGDVVDLNLSVYLTAEREVTQVVAEHAASFRASPEDRNSLVMFRNDDDVLETDPGGTCFAFTQAQHRSVELFDRDALRSFVSRAFPTSEHSRSTSIADLGEYIAGRIASNDSEWIAVRDDSKRKKWKQLAAQHAIPDSQLALDSQKSDDGTEPDLGPTATATDSTA